MDMAAQEIVCRTLYFIQKESRFNKSLKPCLNLYPRRRLKSGRSLDKTLNNFKYFAFKRSHDF